MRLVHKILKYGYYLLFFTIPLVLHPKTSEIFEFNKMVTAYLLTAVVMGLWVSKMIFSKKIIFRKTALDKPILIFLLAMSVATLFSVDPRTSLLGYYSRFNGGLLSLMAYSLLYWAYVSNFGKKETKVVFKILFISTLISSIWAILEHFGHSFSCLIFLDFKVFDNSCWVQDVQNRVYSTFGQPNWLAAWLTALSPIAWALYINSKQIITKVLYLALSTTFVTTLLFTKSRSGIIAFLVSIAIFSCYYLFLHNRQKLKNRILSSTVLIIILFAAVSVVGTPWTPALKFASSKTDTVPNIQKVTSAPALETGGTESGEIRKIVWKGALDIWKTYPVFGTGLETFAYTYYNFKPAAHNLTSEWDFLYNKAHNEYLNYLATTGTVGTSTYLLLIVITIWQLIKINRNKSSESKDYLIKIALLSGYTTILVTNFFGFSTVPINLLFFVIPAFGITLDQNNASKIKTKTNFNSTQKVLFSLCLIITGYVALSVVKYWNADYTYSKGKLLNDSGSYITSINILALLVEDNPKEAIYWDELSMAEANLAIYYSENSNEEEATKLAQKSYIDIKKAIELSPANIILKRQAAVRLINLAAIDPNYLLLAKTILENAVTLAPTDAKLHYNLSLAYLRTSEYDKAIETIKKTIALKPNYEIAHYALGIMYLDLQQEAKAKEEFEYILNNINPDNKTVQRALNELTQ